MFLLLACLFAAPAEAGDYAARMRAASDALAGSQCAIVAAQTLCPAVLTVNSAIDDSERCAQLSAAGRAWQGLAGRVPAGSH